MSRLTHMGSAGGFSSLPHGPLHRAAVDMASPGPVMRERMRTPKTEATVL